MRTAFLLALAGLAAAAPRPQSMDFQEIDSEAEAKTTIIGPAVNAVTQAVSYNPSAAASAAVITVATNHTTPQTKRDLDTRTDVNAPCAQQPDGYGPKPSTDTVAAFLSDPDFQSISSSAQVPQGYSLSFSGAQGSVQSSVYLGLYTLQSYDTIKCQQLCDAAPSCYGINIYFERDPTLNPAANCTNPPSFTNIKCTLWGSAVSGDQATNTGQYRETFQVVIAGSNGYNKLGGGPPPPRYTDNPKSSDDKKEKGSYEPYTDHPKGKDEKGKSQDGKH